LTDPTEAEGDVPHARSLAQSAIDARLDDDSVSGRGVHETTLLDALWFAASRDRGDEVSLRGEDERAAAF
jgi:hypothetical protein